MATRLRPRTAHALDLQRAGTAGVCRDVFPDGWKADAQGVGCRRVRVLCCEDVAVSIWQQMQQEEELFDEVSIITCNALADDATREQEKRNGNYVQESDSHSIELS